MTNEIILCRTARLDDAGTRQAVRDRVLPALRKEADELEACRLQCEARADWLDDWVAAGMLTEEVTIRQAIAHAEKRLAEYACLKTPEGYRIIRGGGVPGESKDAFRWANPVAGSSGEYMATKREAIIAARADAGLT